MYPTFRIADCSYVFGAPYSEEVKRRSGIFATNLTMANADADRISLGLKSNFATIAAARPISHLELLCRFLMAVSRPPSRNDLDSRRRLKRLMSCPARVTEWTESARSGRRPNPVLAPQRIVLSMVQQMSQHGIGKCYACSLTVYLYLTTTGRVTGQPREIEI
jgi:hypothetical protein